MISKMRATALWLLTSVLVSTVAYPQSAPADGKPAEAKPAEPTPAQQIFQKAIEAQGGAKLAKSLNDMVLSYDIDINSQQGRTRMMIEQDFLQPDCINTKQLGNDEKTVILEEATNGKIYWVRDRDRLTVLDRSAGWREARKKIRDRLEQARLLSRVFFLSNLREALTGLRALDAPDKRLVWVAATAADDKAWDFTSVELGFAPETYELREAVLYPKPTEVRSSTVIQPQRLLFEDYKRIDGVNIPQKISVREVAGDATTKIVIYDVVFNKGLTALDFDPKQ